MQLDDAECRRLLATVAVGHLGFTDGALPAIVPVPFAWHAGQVLVPVAGGSPLAGAVRGAVVAFGVDSFDPATESGWSVLVVGPSRVDRAPYRLGDVPPGAVPAWWTAPGRWLITIEAGLLRGWRTVRDPTPLDHDPEPSA